jgi:hypothetical protein
MAILYLLCFLCYLLLVRRSFLFIREHIASNLPVNARLGGDEDFVEARKLERVAVQRRRFSLRSSANSAVILIRCGLRTDENKTERLRAEK